MLLKKVRLTILMEIIKEMMLILQDATRLAARPEVAFVHFQHCAFGGSRPKWGALLHFPGGAFAPLEKICPGEGPAHRHEPWGRLRGGGFATAAETVYPAGLCTAIADCGFAAVDLEAGKPRALLVARGGHDLKRHRPVRAAAARCFPARRNPQHHGDARVLPARLGPPVRV